MILYKKAMNYAVYNLYQLMLFKKFSWITISMSDGSKYVDLYTPLSPKVSWYIGGNGELWKQKDEDGSTPSFVTILRQDYFK